MTKSGERERDPRPPSMSRRLFTGATLAALSACAEPAPRGPSSPLPAAPEPQRPEPEPQLAPQPAPAPDPAPPHDDDLALFRAHPALREHIPRAALGRFPTPVERAVDLGAHLGLPSLWVKRDDVSGDAYGGGKVRKLELFLGEARLAGADTVITSGGVGSNHAVATTIYASQLGLRAVLLLLPEPADDRVREHLLADVRFGGEVRLVAGHADLAAAARPSAAGRVPYVIAVGGSSPLGNVGFVSAAFELKEQIARGEMPAPDVIYVAMGTMGTAVGLALGLRAAGLATRVVAVRASSPGTSSEAEMLAMAAETEAYLRARDPSFPRVGLHRGDITVEGAHLGAGYGRATPKGLAAIAMARDLAGLALDPVYTGKALAALVDAAGASTSEVVLFWNTHNGRSLDLRGVGPRDLPVELRAYFVGSADRP